MKYEELIDLILRHNHLYYDIGKPEISDQEWDELYDLLVSIEKKQGWVAHNSPSLHVGGKAGKVKHPVRLYSLRKVYDQQDVDSEFDIKTPKIDGTNLTLIYDQGKLQLGLTRGDGEFGEDVTHLAKEISNLPKTLIGEEGLIIVTGECVTNNQVENFRNYVSGALGLKSAKEFKTRNIQFIAHDLLDCNLDYTTRMSYLAHEGFDTVLKDSITSKYPQDGVVYRINSWRRSQDLGYTSKYPRFAVALKPREKLTAATMLKQVLWEVGRTGTVNPVGLVEPVVLDDATISRVTLHNMQIILDNNLGLGDIIEIERAGGVIPKFLRVLEHATHNQKVTKDDAEKAIGGETYFNGPRLYVKDPDAHGTVKLLHHFIKTLEIKGLGPQSVAKLGLTHPVDLYSEQPWHLLGANGTKVEQEIEKSKTKPYKLVLAALGIEGVGKSTAERIVEVIPFFERLHEIEFTDIKSIGPMTKEKILAWLDINEEWVLELPLQLKTEISTVLEPKTIKKVCISGKLDLKKSELAEEIEKYGFTVVDSVTKDCYALITGDKSSTKTEKAEKYGVKVIDYWENKTGILQGMI
jgi:DNA ligase (NAD+)